MSPGTPGWPDTTYVGPAPSSSGRGPAAHCVLAASAGDALHGWSGVPRPLPLSLPFPFQAGPGTLIMATGIQDFSRTEYDRLNEIKGHLEIALLEKHFLRECLGLWHGRGGVGPNGGELG